MTRIGKGLGSLILLLVLLVGIPAGLLYWAGNPIPTLDELTAALTMPDWTGSFLMGTIFPIVGWIAWATFAVAFFAEIPSQIKGVPKVKLPGLGMQQKTVGVLLAAVIALFAPNAAMAADLPASTPVSASASYSVSEAATTAVPGSSADEAVDQVQGPQYTVVDGDTLLRISERTLGSGDRFEEIKKLNLGVEQADGGALDESGWVNPGWVLTLPADAVVSSSASGAAAVETQAPSVEQRTVVEGDTLWDISEAELGAGERYDEIVAMTPGIQDPDLIFPGQTVNIPATAEAAPAPAPVTPPAPVEEATPAPVESAPEAEVEPGAGVDQGAVDGAAGAEEAGAAEAAPEAATPEVSAEEEAAAPAEEETNSGLGFTTAPTPAAEKPDESSTEAVAPPASSADADDEEAGSDEAFLDVAPAATIGGIGIVLASALLTLLGWRRRNRRRNRKPGQRLVEASETVSDVEMQLRMIEDPKASEDIDTALRMLAVWAQSTGNALPQLYALRLDLDSIVVILDEPTELPTPFTPQDDSMSAWIIARSDITPLDEIPAAPYPALIAIGRDEEDSQVYVDLERMGTLNVTGANDEDRHSVLLSYAVQLATIPWSEDVQVTLVGFNDPLLDSLGTGRIRQVDDVDTLLRNLQRQADDVETALQSAGFESIPHARGADLYADAWEPEIIILSGDPTDEVKEQLSELSNRIPRVGIAALSNGSLAGRWNLTLSEQRTATLGIPGTSVAIPLSVEMISPEESQAILAEFNAANSTDVIGPVIGSEIEIDEISVPAEDLDDARFIGEPTVGPLPFFLDVEQAAASEDAPVIGVTAERGGGYSAEADQEEPVVESVDADVDVLTEAHSAEEPTEVEEAEVVQEAPELADVDVVVEERPLAPVTRIHSDPYVQLLGTVEVVGARGEAPVNPSTAKQWPSVIRRGTELVAFLSLTTNATAESVHAAFFPGQPAAGEKGNRDRAGLISKTRKWLGNADDGALYLPKITDVHYLLNPALRSDWNDFQYLIGDDVEATPTDKLVEALSLVKGQPISGVPDNRYGWADHIRNEMIALIEDAAHELSTRSLASGSLRYARMASAIGRMVNDANELHWRDALRAEHMAGDGARIERLITQLEQVLAGIGEEEPEPETRALIAQLRRRHAVAS